MVVVTHELEPGTWWVTAFDGVAQDCDISRTEDLGPGDTLYWTVSEFPGTFSEVDGCSLKES